MASNTGHIVEVMMFMMINETHKIPTTKKTGLIQIRMTLDHRKLKYED